MKSLFVIPEKPVDKYKLEWFHISVSPDWCYIRSMSAVYYANTPWSEYSPESKGGADLVDDWMIYSDGNAQGRWCGWDAATGDMDYWEDCFLTREDAVAESIKRLNSYVTEYSGRIKHIKNLVADLGMVNVPNPV